MNENQADTRHAGTVVVGFTERPRMRYARKGGGFMASRAAENIGVRTSNLTVRVMHREYIGRPVKGDRRRLGAHLFGVAEYHGTRCYRVIGATDSLTAALSLAEDAVRELGKDAQLVVLPQRKRQSSKATGTGAPKRTKPVKIKRADATIKAPKMASQQALHVRDINRHGYCNACQSDSRSRVCGKPEKVSPPRTLADAFAMTAHLRGE